MMRVSLAEFIGGKEADDAYNRLCDLTGMRWDAERTCEMSITKQGPRYVTYHFSCCDEFYVESMTDRQATELPGKVCPYCGAKVVDEKQNQKNGVEGKCTYVGGALES